MRAPIFRFAEEKKSPGQNCNNHCLSKTLSLGEFVERDILQNTAGLANSIKLVFKRLPVSILTLQSPVDAVEYGQKQKCTRAFGRSGSRVYVCNAPSE